MSTYFDSSQFRAIDSDAAQDGEPLSAALEAQIANNHHYLHTIGGGSAVKLGTPVGTGQTDDQELIQASFGLSSLHYGPFLVTRGLSEVRIDWHGRIDDYDLPVRLELTGFGVVDALWEQTGGDNAHRFIVLTLPAPAEYEFDTDLVLWQIGRIGDLVGDLAPGFIGNGRIEIADEYFASAEPARTIVGIKSGDEDDEDSITPYETLARKRGNLSNSEPGTLGETTTANSSLAVQDFSEAALARVGMRSIQITMRHA